ncbi:GNAT family N-acetyltransferase [Dongia sp.]|uniref:GNAT family N-acetyltransferase n=1 Tax=Dongia sp. TaxID=1977262 RepID=UPI0037520BC2
MNQDWVVRQLNRQRPARLAFEIRKAGRSDILEMRGMQERAMMTIGGRFYSRSEIETFLNLVGTMDDAVVEEGHFFVAVDPFERVIGTGAWSNLIPGYARVAGGQRAAPAIARPAAGTATVRSVFVAPECMRRGIAQAIMQRIDSDAAASGMIRLQLTATLSGEAFYRAMGYAAEPRGHVELPDGTKFGCVKMKKPIALRTVTAA